MNKPTRRRLAKVALAVTAIALLPLLLFALRVDGSGWRTYQLHMRSHTMARLYELGSAVLAHREAHGSLPDADSLAQLADVLAASTSSSIPVEDEWRQKIGYKRQGDCVVLWSTGLGGGDAGPPPDRREALVNCVTPMFDFFEDVILEGGDCPGRIAPDTGPVFVQWPEGIATYEEGPFNLGGDFGTLAFKARRFVFGEPEVVEPRPTNP